MLTPNRMTHRPVFSVLGAIHPDMKCKFNQIFMRIPQVALAIDCADEYNLA